MRTYASAVKSWGIQVTFPFITSGVDLKEVEIIHNTGSRISSDAKTNVQYLPIREYLALFFTEHPPLNHADNHADDEYQNASGGSLAILKILERCFIDINAHKIRGVFRPSCGGHPYEGKMFEPPQRIQNER